MPAAQAAPIADEGAGRHTVVLAYHHVIADAHAIMRLLLQATGVYRGGVLPERSVGHARDWPRSNRVRLVRCAGAMMRTARQYFVLRSAHRPVEDRGASNRTLTRLCRMTGDHVERLRAACRRRGCGLNDAVLASVAAQSRRLKQRRDGSDPAAKLTVLKYGWPLLRIPQRKSSYRKLFPICAGVSSVAVDSGLARSLGTDVVRYVRAAPPGPSMPMVFSPTLLDSTLELALVYRPTHIAPPGVSDLLEDVVQRLQEMAESPCENSGPSGMA